MIIHDFSTLNTCREVWDRVAKESDTNIDKLFGSFRILSAWYRTRAKPEEVFCIFSPDHDDDTHESTHGKSYGLPLFRRTLSRGIRLLSTPTCDNGWYAPVIGRADEESAREVFLQLERSQDWNLITLQHVDLSRVFWSTLTSTFRDHGFSVVSYPTMKIGTAEIGENAEEYFKRLDGDFRRELRRKSRRLEEHAGTPVVSLTTDGDEVDRAHLEGFSLEARGWKSRAHSAVLQDRATSGYFKELSHAAAAKNSLALISVTCGGRLIFFHYCLREGKEAYLFKTVYDEDFQTYGAGQLGTMHTLKTLHQQGIRRFNFFGQHAPWQKPWQPRITQYAKVVIGRREAPAMFAMTQYYAYASVKRSPLLYRMLVWLRKYYYIATTVRDAVKALVKHLR